MSHPIRIIDVSELPPAARETLWFQLGRSSTGDWIRQATAFFEYGGSELPTYGTVEYAKDEYPDILLTVAKEVVTIELLPPTTIVHDGYTYTRGEKA